MKPTISPLEQARLSYRPALPAVLEASLHAIAPTELAGTSGGDDPAIRDAFPGLAGANAVRLAPASDGPPSRPLKVGVVLSGGQAPGGHNVIVGLHDALTAAHAESCVIGFLAGPRGIFRGDHRVLSAAEIDAHRNTGGFDMIGSGRDKIESDAQLAACHATCERLGLDGLVVIGGDDSNTNAAVLAEYFVQHGQPTVVVGAPKTIDGDLKGGGIEASFGFDTATKVYSELIGNIERDARSAKKYWHFIKLMGRSASHVTLECALATRPNVALIGEEVRRRNWTLAQVTDHVTHVVRTRAEAGKHYGVCLVPEGLIEFIPEVGALISELNILLAEGVETDELAGRLTPPSAAAFAALPERIQSQLLIDRDSHGNVQVSRIDTEALLVATVGKTLGGGKYQEHFFGYEGRCAAPSNFDANYTAAIGRTAAALVAHGRTGYICAVGNLAADPASWTAGAVPITSLMGIETRKGKPVPVISKALVDLSGAPFNAFDEGRGTWGVEDAYVYPGPIQYFGPDDIAGRTTETLQLEAGER
jgi:pyrophosphate--fructose-6-phosphate 1-phosphotransferase